MTPESSAVSTEGRQAPSIFHAANHASSKNTADIQCFLIKRPVTPEGQQHPFLVDTSKEPLRANSVHCSSWVPTARWQRNGLWRAEHTHRVTCPPRLPPPLPASLGWGTTWKGTTYPKASRQCCLRILAAKTAPRAK